MHQHGCSEDVGSSSVHFYQPFCIGRELTTRAESTANEVAETVEGLYENYNTKEGRKDIFVIAAATDLAAKDTGQVRIMKCIMGEALMTELGNDGGQYFKPELVSRGVSKSRKFKWLVKVGACKDVNPLI